MQKVTIKRIEDGAVIDQNDCRVELNGETKCAICQDEYAPDDVLRMTPCNHWFHEKCLEDAFKAIEGRCPMCRHECVSPTTSSVSIWVLILLWLALIIFIMTVLIDVNIPEVRFSLWRRLHETIPVISEILEEAIDPGENFEVYRVCTVIAVFSLAQYIIRFHTDQRRVGEWGLFISIGYAAMYRFTSILTQHSLLHILCASDDTAPLVVLAPPAQRDKIAAEVYKACYPFIYFQLINSGLITCFCILLFLYVLNKICGRAATVITDYLLSLYVTLYGYVVTPAPFPFRN